MAAFDGSDLSRRALIEAIDLSAKLDSPLFVLNVVERVRPELAAVTYAPSDEAVVEQAVAQSDLAVNALLQEAHERAAAAGITITTESVVGNEVDAIVDAVNRHRCDLLVVGLRRHPGLLERIAPGTGSSLTARAPCSILGVR